MRVTEGRARLLEIPLKHVHTLRNAGYATQHVDPHQCPGLSQPCTTRASSWCNCETNESRGLPLVHKRLVLHTWERKTYPASLSRCPLPWEEQTIPKRECTMGVAQLSPGQQILDKRDPVRKMDT